MKKSFTFKLKNLLAEFLQLDNLYNCEITGLAEDSRKVNPGDLFFARPGTLQDGRKYIEAAIASGAVAVLTDGNTFHCDFFSAQTKIPIISIPNLAQNIGLIAARFYGYPSREMTVIGITGTNGKSSCAHFIAQALQARGESCGVLGTLGNGIYGQLQASNLTTLDAISLQQMLADFLKQGVKYVAMEVASHGLVQHRVAGVEFDVAVFTNLTRDHLDYHGTMENYAQAKRLLFEKPTLKSVVFNLDDPCGLQWAQELSTKLNTYGYTLQNNNHHSGRENIVEISAHHAKLDMPGVTATLNTQWGSGVLHNPNLIGQFNLSNLLAVTTVLGILGEPLEMIVEQLAHLHGVAGRMETYGGKNKPLAVIDYAHTPDALEQVLKTLSENKNGQTLWCVFGCGGERDRGKRPLMGKVTEEYADQIIITDDNPRHEDPKIIVREILDGLKNPENAVIEHDRRRAISHALQCAKAGDIVLIAGKGHETYQIVNSEKQPFSDAVEVQKFFSQ